MPRRCAAPAPRSPGQSADSAPVRVLEDGAESAAQRGDRLEVDLGRALDQDEIGSAQPQVSVTTGKIRRRGAGALGPPKIWRIGRPTLFSVAEGSDYLVQLSDHVQRKAIVAAAAWT